MKRRFLTAVSAILVITLTACSTANLTQTSDEVTTVPTETIEETTEPNTEPTTELTNPATENATTPETESPTENTTTPSPEPSTELPEPSDNPTTNTPASTPAPTITYTDVDETVYATGTVNVRSGPGTDHIKLGQLKKGDSIKRKGIGDNGWSCVEYDGQVAYIFSSYLSTTKPFSDTGSAGSPIDSNNRNGNPGASSNGGSQVTYVGPANTATGISWDGKSPIIYTYPDGTTGTEPKEGATYESRPGVITTVTTHIIPESNDSGSADGVFHCEHCGKVCGDGSDGTCVRWLVGGNHTCTCCGETVPGHTCHSCDED